MGDVPEALDDLVRRHAPQGPLAASHPRAEAVEHRAQVVGHGREDLGAQRGLVRHDAGARQLRCRIVGQAGEFPYPYRQMAQTPVEGHVLDRDPRHSLVQEPRHRHQQAGRPRVAVQSEAGDHVGPGRLPVVPQHLRVVPGEEGVQSAAAGGELVGAHPAGAAGGGLGVRERLGAQPGKDLGQARVRVRHRRGRRTGEQSGQGHAGTTESRSFAGKPYLTRHNRCLNCGLLRLSCTGGSAHASRARDRPRR